MGAPMEPPPVKLVMGLIYGSEANAHSALGALAERLGPVDMECSPFPFDFTAYYEEEMGGPLARKFVSFRDLVQRATLPDTKLMTNAVEEEMAVPGKGRRTVNLDPGYLSPENLVLATTKGYSHRPYLRDGIYAELVYIYRGGTFAPLEWTYRDYRDARSIAFFNEVRKGYMRQLSGKN